MRTCDSSDMSLPHLVVDRTETLEPSVHMSRTLSDAPNFKAEKTEAELPDVKPNTPVAVLATQNHHSVIWPAQGKIHVY